MNNEFTHRFNHIFAHSFVPISKTLSVHLSEKVCAKVFKNQIINYSLLKYESFNTCFFHQNWIQVHVISDGDIPNCCTFRSAYLGSTLFFSASFALQWRFWFNMCLLQCSFSSVITNSGGETREPVKIDGEKGNFVAAQWKLTNSHFKHFQSSCISADDNSISFYRPIPVERSARNSSGSAPNCQPWQRYKLQYFKAFCKSMWFSKLFFSLHFHICTFFGILW